MLPVEPLMLRDDSSYGASHAAIPRLPRILEFRSHDVVFEDEEDWSTFDPESLDEGRRRRRL
jgi:hypothetical protein